ncbi:hypothetical protein Cgig2_025847 [Carnegiea gigantea]|uniref:Pollen-specific protein C13 n=1 Tax=Carnegiea gigantea TaxID=171969 RepID=A0A9Q1JT30_9CARY|nr:hypothetical protein Cgig2_025847 [Carnegiea gigantea]
MAKTVMVIAALCLLPAIAMAVRPVAQPFVVKGRVYCDTCRAGFETTASIYLHGAKVRLECRHRHSQEVLYAAEATTDETGTYSIPVKQDQKDRVCETMLVKSSHSKCSSPDAGRDRSRVILTSYNGVVSYERFANNMGFMMDEPMAYCSQLLQQYELDDESRF